MRVLQAGHLFAHVNKLKISYAWAVRHCKFIKVCDFYEHVPPVKGSVCDFNNEKKV